MNDQAHQPADIGGLESALRERARTLAEQYLESGRRQRDQIIADATERLRIREEREILAAKAMADRAYRRHVQAAEIKQQEELDKLRWSLVQAVLNRLPERAAEIMNDEARYERYLQRLLRRAAHSIERDELVVELNGRDRARLAPRWEGFVREAAPGKRVALSDAALDSTGGMVVASGDGAIRVDDTFNGRLDRLREDIYREVTQRLFATTEAARVSAGR